MGQAHAEGDCHVSEVCCARVRRNRGVGSGQMRSVTVRLIAVLMTLLTPSAALAQSAAAPRAPSWGFLLVVYPLGVIVKWGGGALGAVAASRSLVRSSKPGAEPALSLCRRLHRHGHDEPAAAPRVDPRPRQVRSPGKVHVELRHGYRRAFHERLEQHRLGHRGPAEELRVQDVIFRGRSD
jgi:hypothetical protein